MVAALLAGLLAWAAAAQEVPAGQKSTRPCPELLRAVDGWIAELAGPLTEAARKQVHARLLRAGEAGAIRLAATLEPAQVRLAKAQSEGRPEARGLLAQVLDLIGLLGETRRPEAFAALDRAAGRADWTDTLRRTAIVALGRLADPRALPRLAGLLPSTELGYEAGKALLAIERFESVPHWIALLESRSPDLQVGAHERLKTWSGEQLPAEQKRWEGYFSQYPEGFRRLPGYKKSP